MSDKWYISGPLGIGTEPDRSLHVTDGGANLRFGSEAEVGALRDIAVLRVENTKPNSIAMFHLQTDVTAWRLGIDGRNGGFQISNAPDLNPTLTIASGGRVGIGTANPQHSLHVQGSRSALALHGDSVEILLMASGMMSSIVSNGGLRILTGGEAIRMTNESVVLHNEKLTVNSDGIILRDGNAWKPGGGPWGDRSDIRLKCNISALDNSLDRLLHLRGVSFEWKDPKRHGGLTGQQRGFIAQEAEQVFPEWVGIDAQGYKTLTIRGFEALVVEAFRELKADRDTIHDRLGQLESRMHDLDHNGVGVN